MGGVIDRCEQRVMYGYDTLEPEDPLLEEMKTKTIEDGIKTILLTPNIQQQILIITSSLPYNTMLHHKFGSSQDLSIKT